MSHRRVIPVTTGLALPAGTVLYHNYRTLSAADLSGNGHDGTVYGGATFDATTGVQLDGATQYVSSGAWDVADMTNWSLLVRCVPADGSALQAIAGKSTFRTGTGLDHHWGIYQNAGVISAQGGTPGATNRNANAGYVVGTSYHLAMIMTAGTFRLWVDGVAQSTPGTISGTINSAALPVRTGSLTNQVAYLFAGSVASLMLVERPIDGTELGTIIAGGY